MKIHILGSGGWLPANNRLVCCYLIEHKDKLIMLDAGVGVANLAHYKDVLAKYDTIHVVLSHYHLDHTSGIIFFSNFLKNYNIIFHTPKNEFYLEGGEMILDKLTQKELFSRPLLKLGKTVQVRDFDSDFDIDNMHFSVRRQKHTAPSYAFSIDGKLAYITDTKVDEHTFEWAKTCDLVLHECWELEPSGSEHSSLSEIEGLTKKYTIKNLQLIHLNPNLTLCEYNSKITCTNIKPAIDLSQMII